jgi:hypothetical protein
MLLQFSVCPHAIANTPVGPLARVASRGRTLDCLCQGRRPSPNNRRVGSHITAFEACSAFTRVTACGLAESLERPVFLEGFDGFVTSAAAPIATGWSD